MCTCVHTHTHAQVYKLKCISPRVHTRKDHILSGRAHGAQQLPPALATQRWPMCLQSPAPESSCRGVGTLRVDSSIPTLHSLEEVGAQWKKGPGEDVNPGLWHSPSQLLPMLTQLTLQKHGDRSPPGCLPLQRKGLKHPESWEVGLWSPLE